MLPATEIPGAQPFDSAGNFVGRVKEMFIEPADQPNRVARLLLSRGQYRPIVARYDQIASVAPGRVNLTTDESALELFHPNEAWLAVGKDLLDQQIIDTNGRKVVRVNDIDLAEQRTNGNVEMRITQVDVGVKGAVRRLLQGIVPPMAIRRLEKKLPPRSIRWEFVNLIEPDPLRRVKLRMSSQKLTELHPADLAEIMEELSPAERQGIIDSLPEDTAAEAIAELDKRLQTQVVEALMRYEENTAGGMINTELVIVGEDATRGEVVDYIRFNEIVPDQLDNIVLINHYGALSGTVPIARLVIANSEQRMDELRFEPIVSVHPDANEKEVFDLFDKYNLRGLTVIDADNRPIGAITVDDVVSRMNAKL